jgi:hypothetical protein
MATIYAFVCAAIGVPYNADNAVNQSACLVFGMLLLLASHLLCAVLSFSLQARDGP